MEVVWCHCSIKTPLQGFHITNWKSTFFYPWLNFVHDKTGSAPNWIPKWNKIFCLFTNLHNHGVLCNHPQSKHIVPQSVSQGTHHLNIGTHNSHELKQWRRWETRKTACSYCSTLRFYIEIMISGTQCSISNNHLVVWRQVRQLGYQVPLYMKLYRKWLYRLIKQESKNL